MIKIGELLRKLWSLRSCFLILPPGALTPQGIKGAMKRDEAWREQTLVCPPLMCQQRLSYCTWELNVMLLPEVLNQWWLCSFTVTRIIELRIVFVILLLCWTFAVPGTCYHVTFWYASIIHGSNVAAAEKSVVSTLCNFVNYKIFILYNEYIMPYSESSMIYHCIFFPNFG